MLTRELHRGDFQVSGTACKLCDDPGLQLFELGLAFR